MDTFDVIFTTYSPLVFRYLRSLSGDAAVAEELTAETFYRNTIGVLDKMAVKRNPMRKPVPWGEIVLHAQSRRQFLLHLLKK